MKINIPIVVLCVALALVLGLLGKIAYTNHQLSNVNEQLNEKLMQSDLNLGRANTKFGDAMDMIRSLNDDINKEIRKRKAIATRYGILQAKYDVIAKAQPVDNVRVKIEKEYVQVPAELNLEKGAVYIAKNRTTLAKLNEYTGRMSDHRIDVDCTIRPEANDELNIPMEIGYQLHQTFGGQLVETRLPSGGINHYMELYELGPKGERIKHLKLEKFEVVVADELAPRWFWWAPGIDIAGLVGAGPENLPYIGGSLGLSFMGYGRTTNDLSWRFLRVSLDFGTDIGVGFTPVLYNLGELIPLISNLWVGPHVQKGFLTSWTVGGVIGARL